MASHCFNFHQKSLNVLYVFIGHLKYSFVNCLIIFSSESGSMEYVELYQLPYRTRIALLPRKLGRMKSDIWLPSHWSSCLSPNTELSGIGGLHSSPAYPLRYSLHSKNWEWGNGNYRHPCNIGFLKYWVMERKYGDVCLLAAKSTGNSSPTQGSWGR